MGSGAGIRQSDMHLLARLADEMHLDAMARGVVARLVTEACEVEVAVTAQPGDQPGPSRLASGGAGPGSFDMLCPRERSGLHLYSTVATRSGCRPVESAAQRGRRCGDAVGPDNAGAPRPISHPATWRVPRCFQRGCGFLPGAGSGSVRTADRRSSCRAAAGLAGTRESALAASIGICLLRWLFYVDRGDAGPGTHGASDETLGGPERRSHR
jgi:hypothetical protein